MVNQRSRLSQSERISPFLLVGTMLLAFALRIYQLDAQSLWYDEGVTADVAQRNLVELTRWTANDIQPPLYYYIVAGWGRLAGWSEWSLRFPSAFFGTLLVPTLTMLTVRLSGRRGAGGLAAFFTALHPLLLYYSQEARMYTLLLVLGVLTAYCVVRSAWDGHDRLGFFAYILIATATIYTHYFAFFLLLALAIAFFLDQFRQPLRTTRVPSGRVLRTFLLANLIVLFLYIPWFTTLFNRLAVDASYWQGRLKWWEALRSVAVSFTGGETVRETQAVWLLLPFAGVTLFALFELWPEDQRSNEQSRLLRYALPWLIMPVAAVLTLASFAPKFNARYVMLALPGLILIWAAGLSARWPGKSDNSLVSLRVVTVITSLLFTVGAFLYADRNWFADPNFTKDEWRAVATFLRPRLKPDETVLLVSGHAWPVWNYYAPDLPAVRLPAIDVLDVNAVLTFANTTLPLRAAFAAETGKTAAWIIEWQDEVVDPTGIVPVQLELAGREKGQSVTFWGLSVQRFSGIKPNRIAEAPPIKTVLEANFGNQLILHGYT
ncbi:MAG: glycosyltransferase family 39 protein, partial [Chloroflexota bacterium]|nr:glycosyltransferase family 39 protein [Chloroflexota bacterium]